VSLTAGRWPFPDALRSNPRSFRHLVKSQSGDSGAPRDAGLQPTILHSLREGHQQLADPFSRDLFQPTILSAPRESTLSARTTAGPSSRSNPRSFRRLVSLRHAARFGCDRPGCSNPRSFHRLVSPHRCTASRRTRGARSNPRSFRHLVSPQTIRLVSKTLRFLVPTHDPSIIS
jgi:hypothetical protein